MNQHADEINVLKALNGLNGYATSRQIGAEYRREFNCEIGTERLETALTLASTNGWVTTPYPGYYKITSAGKEICSNAPVSPVIKPKVTAPNIKCSDGSRTRKTPDDVFCPFCKVYYPFGTVKCPMCGATIGAQNQIRKERPKAEPETPRNVYEGVQSSSDNRGNSHSAGGTILSIILALSAVGASSWVYGTGAVVSESSDTGMGDVMNGSSSSIEPTTETSTGLVEEGGTVGTTMLSGLPVISLASAGCGSSSEDGPVLYEDSFGNWHLGDNVPYSIVEKRAEHIYDVLHKKSADERKNILVVAQNSQYGDLMNQLFGSQRSDLIEDKIELWISLLE